jgi:hypothetical protein
LEFKYLEDLVSLVNKISDRFDAAIIEGAGFCMEFIPVKAMRKNRTVIAREPHYWG